MKSIYEKAYLIQAQAIKAAEKEFGETWHDRHEVVQDGKKFVVRLQVATIAPAPIADLGQADADRQANASMGPLDAKPRLSSCEKPTKRVWHIADSMPKASRKDVMAECVRQGIAYGTARTQYQAWFKASQESARTDIRQPHAKGE